MQSVTDDESKKNKNVVTERGCCFSVKYVELYVIKETVGMERERCRDEENTLDGEEMIK
jgi:hypothetical protein